VSVSAIEQKIQQLSTDYIYYEALASLLLLLMSAAEEEAAEYPAIPYDIHPEILEMKQTVRDYLCRLEEILSDEDERLRAIDDCTQLKKALLSAYENIYGYYSQWNVYSMALSDEIALRKYQEEQLSEKPIQWQQFYLDCKAFLNESDTVLQQKSRISQLLKCFSLKMTRNKYFDILKDCLEKAFQEESEDTISSALRAFQRFCAPEDSLHYGRYFPEIAQWLSQKKVLSPEKMEDALLREEYESFQDKLDDLNHIEEYFSILFNDINSLILLFSLTYKLDELTERDVSYSDLYHTVRSMILGKMSKTEKEAYIDTLIQELEMAVEPIIDKANALGQKEIALLEKTNSFEDFSDETKKILMTESFVRSCYYSDLNNELFVSDQSPSSPPAKEEWKKAAFEKFLAQVQVYWASLSPKVRHISMQMLLGALPPVFTAEQTLQMLQDALESAPTTEHKVLIVDKTAMVFSDNNFSLAAQEEHIHQHDCGCGHHYEHEHHDCNCNHEHHHHH
jgi:hypothetical protein